MTSAPPRAEFFSSTSVDEVVRYVNRRLATGSRLMGGIQTYTVATDVTNKKGKVTSTSHELRYGATLLNGSRR